MNLGEKLCRLRTERGIYLKELAAELHLSISAVSSYENGVHSPDIKTLEKFARFYNVSADYLLGRTECMIPIEDLRRQDVANYINLLKAAEGEGKK